MRLTLRTMLAHLDGILDPADSEDLAQKIAESEFATTLARRIGDCTKRLRLGAPKVLGKGTALDPNTVAEYLDSTLAPERMPDFEKVCLESDVHLAEVAACHHILTMVVGQPAHVDSESRHRMYALAAAYTPAAAEPLVAAANNGNGGGNGAATVVAAAMIAATPVRDDPSTSVDGFPTQPRPQSQPPKPKVPDYLREGARQQRMTTVMIAAAAIALTIVALLFKDRVLSLVGLGESQPTEVAEGNNNGDKAKPPPTGETPSAPQPANEGPALPTKPADEGVDRATAPAPDASANSTSIPPAPGDKLPKTDTPPNAKPPVPATDDTLPPTPPVSPTEPAPPSDDPRQPAAAPRADKAEPVGKLISSDQLLLRFDANAGDWLRVPDDGMVYAGDRIVALPTFRPRLVLPGGLLVELFADSRDGTIVEMLPPDASGALGMKIVHGRLAKISAPGQHNVRLRVVFGKQLATLRLADTTTSAAIDVNRPYAPGDDPMTAPDPLTSTFYATAGSLDVAIEGARPVVVNEGMKLVASPAGVAAPEPASPPPSWFEKPEVEWLDVSAATQLMRDLTPTASVGVVLAEQFHGRRVEGRSLAARSFGYLGRFDPLVTAGLKDEKLGWNWREKILDGLRQSIRRGGETAGYVREALVKEFGDRNGGVMYRMLCGYSPADLKNGADAKLVENLEHADLAFRSLAVFNLSSITGASFGYQPDARENLRRPWVVRWREKLQRREIVYRDGSSPKKPARNGTAAPAATPTSPAAPTDDAPATAPDTPAPSPTPDSPPPPAAGPDGR